MTYRPYRGLFCPLSHPVHKACVRNASYHMKRCRKKKRSYNRSVTSLHFASSFIYFFNTALSMYVHTGAGGMHICLHSFIRSASYYSHLLEQTVGNICYPTALSPFLSRTSSSSFYANCSQDLIYDPTPTVITTNTTSVDSFDPETSEYAL